jgi:putative aldouronate transport system substrate-binding protein
MPTTTDEFYNVLKAFKEQDANGNGDPDDEIPLITCTEGWHVDLDGFLMCSFIYSDPDTKMSVEDGQLIFTPIEEGYREGLRYLNTLYTDGLLSPESFTNDNATNSRLNTINVTDPKDWESPAAIIGSYPFAYQNYQGDTDIWKQYEIMPPLTGPDGFVTTPEYSLTRDVIRANMLITKNAENPDLIMRWVDWFYSFNGTFFRLGREGVDWRAAEPGELDFNGQPAKYNLLQVAEDDPFYNNVDWTQSIPVNYSQEYRESAVAASDFRDATISNGTEVQLFQGTIPYEAVARDVSQSIPGLNSPADLISDYGRIKTEIETYQENAMVQFITGTLSLDGDWDAYVEQLKTIGLDEYMQMSNDAYQSFLNR